MGGKYMSDSNIEKKFNSKIIENFMDKIFEEYLPEKDNLIQILNEVQDEYGYIPELSQKLISEYQWQKYMELLLFIQGLR